MKEEDEARAEEKNPDLTRSFFGAEAADVSVRFGFFRQKTDLDGFAEKCQFLIRNETLIFRNYFLNERCVSTSHCSPINFYRNLVPGKIFPMFFYDRSGDDRNGNKTDETFLEAEKEEDSDSEAEVAKNLLSHLNLTTVIQNLIFMRVIE